MIIPEKAKRRLELEMQLIDIQCELGQLKNSCTHEVIAKGSLQYSHRLSKIVQTYESRTKQETNSFFADSSTFVTCQICGKDFGWFCPRNPKDIYCKYDDSVDSYSNEECIYCGLPEERK